ncbi:MAG: cytochrome c-type biogenesis protein CcmH [Cohaesibacter sp.]|jgi:cytochrome c-type biogenesis protein CcmH|nr:cytochrome c-type biogenesis protein CcmH [Cohaesibacter sp.]
MLIFKRMRQALLALMLLAVPTGGALAVNPDEMLKDPALEARARDISAEIRCLVCQNQSIDDSDAPLAKDLRVLIRERITEGDTNEEAMQFLVSRYGEFVLLKPRFSLKTLLLWGFGPAILILGLFAVHMLYRKNKQAAAKAQKTGAVTLSEEEEAKLKKILSSESES